VIWSISDGGETDEESRRDVTDQLGLERACLMLLGTLDVRVLLVEMETCCGHWTKDTAARADLLARRDFKVRIKRLQPGQGGQAMLGVDVVS